MAVFPTITPPPLRSGHAFELPILFSNYGQGLPGSPSPNITELESTASMYMQNAWSTFIKDPSNGLRKVGWPKYAGNNGGKTLVELFSENNVQNPITLEDPRTFDAVCAQYGF
jgi:carboxylesterase type B